MNNKMMNKNTNPVNFFLFTFLPPRESGGVPSLTPKNVSQVVTSTIPSPKYSVTKSTLS